MRDLIFGPARFRPGRPGRVLECAVAAALALALHGAVTPAAAQRMTRPHEEGVPDDIQRKQLTNWIVGVAGGPRDGVPIRFADDLRRVLSDGDDLTVLPIVSRGPAGSMEDLLHLNDVDIAVTQADAIEYFRTERKTALARRVQYIARLPMSALHVVARDDVRTLGDLSGEKVVFGRAGGSAAMTGTILFRRLGIAVRPVFTDPRSGLDLVRQGQAAALLTVEPKPSDFWLSVPPGAGIHLLQAPRMNTLADLYSADEFTSADYPGLIAPGESVDTIAVAGVLAVQNMPKNDDRFRRVLRFVQYLYARWDWLGKPPYHPGWRDVSLTADIPGWTRFGPSEVLRQFVLWREQQHFGARDSQ